MQEPKEPKQILKVINVVAGITASQMKSVSRKEDIAIARGVYFLLCRRYGVKSKLAVKEVRRKNPSTARHLVRKYRELIEAGNKKAVSIYEKSKEMLEKSKA